MEWTNADTMQFLKLYRNEPAIWDPKHPDHKDRNVTCMAWKRIKNHVNLAVTVMELKAKKESLMATFRKIANKVNAAKEENENTEHYKPSWFAYKFMDEFLSGIYTPRPYNKIADRKLRMAKHLNQQGKKFTCKDNDEEDEDDEDMVKQNTDDKDCPEMFANLSKKRKGCFIRKPELLELYRYLNQVQGGPERDEPEKDQCALFSELLAKKLRDLNEETRDIAMAEINNVMFRLKYNRDQPSFSGSIKTNEVVTEVWENSSSASYQEFDAESLPESSLMEIVKHELD